MIPRQRVAESEHRPPGDHHRNRHCRPHPARYTAAGTEACGSVWHSEGLVLAVSSKFPSRRRYGKPPGFRRVRARIVLVPWLIFNLTFSTRQSCRVTGPGVSALCAGPGPEAQPVVAARPVRLPGRDSGFRDSGTCSASGGPAGRAAGLSRK